MPVAVADGGLNEFQVALMGTWTNTELPGAPNGEGGRDHPLSYDVVAVPDTSSPSGYILKNSTVWEYLRFHDSSSALTVPTSAPNRGVSHFQLSTAVYYEQQVYFGQGPAKDLVVHTENGAWLNLQTIEPPVGPYGTPVGSGPVFTHPNHQPPAIRIAKQMSVPHGNSVLALGRFGGVVDGAPSVPDTRPTTPTPDGILPTDQYSTAQPPADRPDDFDDYQNPRPDYTANPNLPLQHALEILDVAQHMAWSVTTGSRDGEPEGSRGSTANIPFEQRVAAVVDYGADYWLLSTNGSTFDHLAYSQSIDLEMAITFEGTTHTFHVPHVTTNVLTRA